MLRRSMAQAMQAPVHGIFSAVMDALARTQPVAKNIF